MSKHQPGDRVLHDGAERIIVDITGDDMAILRLPEDTTGERLVAVMVNELGDPL